MVRFLLLMIGITVLLFGTTACEVAFRVNTIDHTSETIKQTDEAWYCHVFVCSAADVKRDQER